MVSMTDKSSVLYGLLIKITTASHDERDLWNRIRKVWRVITKSSHLKQTKNYQESNYLMQIYIKWNYLGWCMWANSNQW